MISSGTSFGELVLGAAPGGSMWELRAKAVGGLGPASEESLEGNVPRRIIPCLLHGAPRERGLVMKAWVFTSSVLCNLPPDPHTLLQDLVNLFVELQFKQSVNFPQLNSIAIAGFAGSKHFRARTEF